MAPVVVQVPGLVPVLALVPVRGPGLGPVRGQEAVQEPVPVRHNRRKLRH